MLPDSARLLSPLASGDVLAIPVAGEDVKGATSTSDGGARDQLLMVTSNMKEPVAVDPAASQLPASALAGLSPYFALGLGDYGERDKAVIYDLRNGRGLDISVTGWFAPAIAGHWAVWWTMTSSSDTTNRYSVFLADPDSLTAREVASGTQLNWLSPAVAISPEWLVMLDRREDNGAVSASADLLTFHLPDMGQVRLASVLGADETAGLQLSGNRVLMTVWKGLSNVPHDDPDWTALRVTELSR